MTEKVRVRAESPIRAPARRSAGELDLRRRARPLETVIQAILFLCGALSIVTTIGIVLVLLNEAIAFFALPEVRLVDFLTTTSWQPSIGEFGILPLLNATFTTSLIAMAVAIPLGLGAAIFLSEYATPATRARLKPVLEVLAGVPTVVYGYFALTFMTPLLRAIFGSDTVQIYHTASAGLVMAIMILPLTPSLSEDPLASWPNAPP